MVNRSAGRASGLVRGAARVLRTPESRIRAWGRLILTSLVVTVVVFGARSSGLLTRLENWWLDRMAIADRSPFSAPVTVVAITDEDYFDPALFDGMSPLHPEALKRVLERILEHRPRGVIVDVQLHPAAHETGDREAARLRLYHLLDEVSSAGGPRLVLVRNLDAERVEPSASRALAEAWARVTSNSSLWWADPTIQRSGGYVRAVPRRNPPLPEPGTSSLTVLGAAVEAFELEVHQTERWWVGAHREEATRPRRIRFSGHFLESGSAISPHRLSAGMLLRGEANPGRYSLLTDRIVLLGGTYHAGLDLQPTVIGDMPGVYVWAEAIGSWMRHDALREPLAWISFLLEFLIGVLTGLALIRWGPALGTLLAFLVVGPMSIVSSILTFGSGTLFIDFLPAAICVGLHYQIELHLELGRLRAKVGRYEQAGAAPAAVPESVEVAVPPLEPAGPASPLE